MRSGDGCKQKKLIQYNFPVGATQVNDACIHSSIYSSKGDRHKAGPGPIPPQERSLLSEMKPSGVAFLAGYLIGRSSRKKKEADNVLENVVRRGHGDPRAQEGKCTYAER